MQTRTAPRSGTRGPRAGPSRARTGDAGTANSWLILNEGGGPILIEEARREGRGLWRQVRLTPDPTIKTVVSEDAAAVAGLLLAAGGLALHQLTGSALWDSGAAIAIGVVLIVVAFLLGRDTKELLIGEAADPQTRVALYDDLVQRPEVERVVDLMTMLLGPDSLLVAIRADLSEELSSTAVEDFSTRLDRELRERHERVSVVLLDATTATGEDAQRAERLDRETARLRERIGAGRA